MLEHVDGKNKVSNKFKLKQHKCITQLPIPCDTDTHSLRHKCGIQIQIHHDPVGYLKKKGSIFKILIVSI